MCGLCIEGIFLSGWENGSFILTNMREAPDFMGEEVEAAHVVAELVITDMISVENLLSCYAKYPIVVWSLYYTAQKNPLDEEAITICATHLRAQKLRRAMSNSSWLLLQDTFPLVTEFLDKMKITDLNERYDSSLLDEIECCLLSIHARGYYSWEIASSTPDGGNFAIIELHESEKSEFFVDWPLELFMLTEVLCRLRPTSWVLRLALSVELYAPFNSYYPAWRRYVANHFFERLDPLDFIPLGNSLPLMVIHALAQRHIHNNVRVTQLLEFVENRQSDEQIVPEQLARELRDTVKRL
ncbi:hypothetical protein Q4602_02370 [Paraglaciecola chathamensis]|uniref:hypothetical protein n=1 Tax=Paraglaciecola chathamensis TaxID=368405 RepID=UPI00270FC953|nr:hypothetical protein [Paraglaciecola chathamensis]MDO6838302.1 hypothetical protein [Paraglaciecola chathamensis]